MTSTGNMLWSSIGGAHGASAHRRPGARVKRSKPPQVTCSQRAWAVPLELPKTSPGNLREIAEEMRGGLTA